MSKEPAKQTGLTKSSLLQSMQTALMSTSAISIFRDNLPSAVGKQAEEMARRFAKMVYTAVSQNPDLQVCTPQSIIKAASISASLGLDIDPRGLAYLVPYKDVATFQIGYQGLIELAYRSGKVKDISAHCIYESEKGKVTIRRIDGKFSIEHPFEWEMPKGKMVAVYATAEVEGLGPKTIVLRAEEVEAFRNRSKCPKSPAWRDDYPAMAKKTAIRQLAKFLPKSILEDFAKAAAIDEKESFVDAASNAEAGIQGEIGSQPIDAAFEQPENKELTPPAGEQPKTKKAGQADFLED